ncbi:short chain dehydrogenase [Marinicella meishanensis]|uniref:short chain dehydrogenase n=1 Tax=Marinicella meishanensis TaxID=2873263 RepID=UPI001CBD0536|nr:short chain dehydrogenase [Marinicella sp. NBU2979]
MKILIIGGAGTIGKYVTEHLQQAHEVLVAGRSDQHLYVDIADSSSIQKLLSAVGPLDAIICVAGEAKWDDFAKLSAADYDIGLRSKLMGQVNVVRYGVQHLKPGGSITLSTGILADDPVKKTASAAMVNGGIHSFVQAVALELGSKARINAVSAGVVAASYEKYQAYFPGHNPVPMQKVVNGYVRSVFGADSGKIIRIYE